MILKCHFLSEHVHYNDGMIVIFYLDQNVKAQHKDYGSKELSVVLEKCEILRKTGMRHVCISSELDEHIGKPGVSSVVDGKTPDGLPYEWSKAGRAGRTRASDATKQTTATRNGD
jgi:hypothetical protein